ncbi:MAG: pyridoxamine 5'-phosphate oxidase family protein [Dermatophilaceae bacterium]
MAEQEPVVELGPFSSAGAVPTSWRQARGALEDAQVYWLSTVRPDGRPHVTPLLGVWLHGALYFCTGPAERKAKNLARNPLCAVATGRNSLEGLDLVVEGAAAAVSDGNERQLVADTFESKYGSHFTAPEGTWFGLGDAIRGGDALVYRVTPSTAFGFGKGEQYSQTRFRFA